MGYVTIRERIKSLEVRNISMYNMIMIETFVFLLYTQLLTLIMHVHLSLKCYCK